MRYKVTARPAPEFHFVWLDGHAWQPEPTTVEVSDARVPPSVEPGVIVVTSATLDRMGNDPGGRFVVEPIPA